LMEGMRIIDEERAGMIPPSQGISSSTGTPIPSMGTPTGGVVRAVNPYQTLANDLIKIKGVDGAIVTLRDGTLQAHSNIKSPEKVGMMISFMIYHGGQAGFPGKVGKLRRVSVISSQRKMIIFDQEEFIAAIDCAAGVRYETINPYIERAFRKIQM